ncbi:hypothetical protein TNCV_4954731 [Trichonephila clavipes]|nr:hypothetical protein TNCV_4954731 [Trichonephila clavipes]
MPGKKKLSLQEALELLESLPSESCDAPTDDSSDEEVTANNLLELSSDSEVDDEKIEKKRPKHPLYSENAAVPTSGCILSNAKRIGNCKRLNGIGESEGIIAIRNRSTTSP